MTESEGIPDLLILLACCLFSSFDTGNESQSPGNCFCSPSDTQAYETCLLHLKKMFLELRSCIQLEAYHRRAYIET